MRINKLKVAAYARVSTDKDDQVNSLESQKMFFEKYISENPKWSLVKIYHDDGISGTNTRKRKGFNKMISDAMNGGIDLILTKEVSRFARNTVDSIETTRKLKSNGVGVYFLNDNINTLDGDGELRLTIMSCLAQEESRKTSSRVKWGQKRQMEKGVVFGRDLLGYHVENGKLYIVEEQAKIVKLIFRKFAVEKKGTHVIARELEDAGIKSLTGKPWSNTVILRVIRNEKYVGDLLQKKTYTPDYLDHRKKYNRGQEEKVFIANHHEPIIPRWLWDLAQDELEKRKPTEEMRSKHSNRYWSSGKVFCGECGGRFTVVYKTLVDGTRYRAYRCISSAKAGREHYKNGVKVGCNSVQLKEESIMYCIKECLHHIQYDKKLIIENVFKELNNALIEEKPINLNEVKYKIETIQAKKSKALDMYLSETVDEETYRTTMVKYDKELDKLNEQLETANDIMRAREQTKKDIKKIEREMNIVLNYDGDNENLFSNIIKRIEIFGDRTLLITFTFLPMYQFCVKMHTEGKAGTFKTCINSLEIRTLEQEVQYSN